MITVALDAMGGDNCPDCNIQGALNALTKSSELRIILLGPEEVLKTKLCSENYPSDRLIIMDAKEVISLDESPVQAIQKKKESGIVKGVKLVRDGTADAFVSAGSSGAVLAAGQLKLGRIKGVLRTPLAVLMPTGKGVSLFLDLGANVDAKPEWLYQFAKMGSAYMQAIQGIRNPSVKLINIGLEEEKGNQLTKEANMLLAGDPDLNYEGYAEAREVPYGTADVIVADAFTGNAMLKMYEGTASFLLKTVKSVLKKNAFTKLGGLLIRKELKETLKTFDPSEYGGAPLIGLKGAVIKCHGNSGEKEICNALLQAGEYIESGINDCIAKAFEKV